MLRNSSSYFKSALDGGFKESVENVIVLPEDNPDVFELFTRWLYLKRLDSENQNHVDELVSPRNLVQLYVFAEMRGVSPLQNMVIDLIVKSCERSAAGAGLQTLREIPYIYGNTSERSPPLRAMVVNLAVVDYYMVTTLTPMKEWLPTGFLLDLAVKLKRLAGERAYPGVNQLPNCNPGTFRD